MKKTTRSLLISALILFCAGLILALCASLYAKINKIQVYDVPEKAQTIENRTVKIDDVLKNSPESNYVKKLSETKFTNIDLTSYTGKVVICSGGKDTEIVLDKANTNNISYTVVGDTLTVKDVDAVGFMGFYINKGGISFKGLRHMFNPGNPTNSDKTVTVKIPADFLLSEVVVSSSIGDVVVDGISAEVINVQSKSGTVHIKNQKYADAKITVNGSFTNVKMSNNQYSNCAISTQFGNIETHLLETSNKSTILDVWCGKISVKTDLPTSQYKLSVSTQSGVVSRNGKEIGKKLSNDGNGIVRITSTVFVGDFEIKYAGGKEEDYKAKNPAPEAVVEGEVAAPETEVVTEGTEAQPAA